RPFCMQTSTPSRSRKGVTVSSIPAASYALTVRKIARYGPPSSPSAVAHSSPDTRCVPKRPPITSPRGRTASMWSRRPSRVTVQIDSLSRREGRIAARLARELDELGAEVSFDGAGAEIGGETGNLIAHVPGTVDAPPLLLCAHMDTVEPGVGVRPVVEDDVIRSDGTTVLGG